jgi:hypothetical protein
MKHVTTFVCTTGATFALLWSAASAQVEYVKVCDAYGPGYFYQPSTDTCINADTGETRREEPFVTVRGQTELADSVDDQRRAIDGLNEDVDNLRAGIAATAALPQPYVEQGDRFALSGSWGQYDGQHAFGVGGAYRVDDHLTFSGSAAIPVDGGSVATRAGFNVSW